MIALCRTIHLLLSLLLFFTQEMEANQQILVKSNPSAYISDDVWEQVQDYLMPDDHPVKEKLDQIFLNSRALADQESMVAAGFTSAQLQICTKIVVTRHPELPGYVIKAYLDEINHPKNRPEHYFFIRRVMGARLIRESIRAHNYEHLLKVPEKWLYLLPDDPSPPSGYFRKKFILVEDDMDIFSDQKNESLWRGEWVTKPLLKAFYKVITEVSLADSTKPSNSPFSRDGRVAFVDTQMFDRGFVKYENLVPYLSSSMQVYWEKLTK